MAIETLPQLFLRSVELHDKSAAFGYKADGRWVDVSHRDAFQRVYNAALGLQALNLAKGDRVGLLSENRLEWALADLATLSAGYITVPVYPTLPVSQVEYILRDSEARAVFVSNQAQLDKVVAARARLPRLLHVVSFDRECDAEGVVTLEALVERGRMVSPKPTFPELTSTVGKSDWASIIYTSGTTGTPKGAVLSHWNFVSNVIACLEVLPLGPKDTYLSFLPLSHALERTGGFYAMLSAGVTICYAESLDTLTDDMRAVSPTVMCAVPRFYEKTYTRIVEAVESSSGMRRNLFHWAVKSGRKYVSEKLDGSVGVLTRGRRKLANALVFRRVQARTGGKLRYFISGGAPLGREIAEFFHAAGIPIMEGYGLTETSPVIAVNTFDNLKFGTVGKPLPGVEVSIADDGEILVRGDNVMQGYYKLPEETKAALEGGWFHTGDIGHLDDDGFLVITDRKKDIIVTALGKNVAPQAIEMRLVQSPYVNEAVLVGNRRKFLSVVIVPDFDRLEEFALSSHVPYASREELVTAPQVAELFRAEIDSTCGSLARFEQPQKFVVLPRELTIADGEITPSLKVKRRVVEEKYRAEIDALYEERE
jgi:long-chain acyl-CoA synthetase